MLPLQSLLPLLLLPAAATLTLHQSLSRARKLENLHLTHPFTQDEWRHVLQGPPPALVTELRRLEHLDVVTAQRLAGIEQLRRPVAAPAAAQPAPAPPRRRAPSPPLPSRRRRR